jgi:solute:Na+ symporter, SSS family
VQRYLTARSVRQSRLGLLLNGMAKVPMQFFILFVGAMVFVFYQFNAPPLSFNNQENARIVASQMGNEYRRLEVEYQRANADKEQQIRAWLASSRTGVNSATFERERVLEAHQRTLQIRGQAMTLMKQNDPRAETNDTNHVFLTFVTRYLPAGLVGLVIVVVFGATMSTTSSELNSLATCTVVDIYKRLIRQNASERHYMAVSRIATGGWGLFAILVSERASRLGSLIEAVNILGSLFYGTVLGIFILAFLFKRVGGTAAFVAALFGEAFVLYLFKFTTISFLWYNVFGALTVVAVAVLFSLGRYLSNSHHTRTTNL